MDPKILKTVVAQVQRRFPEFAGSQPKVRQQNAPQAKSASAAPTYLLTFQSSAKVAGSDGSRTMPRWVRVVVSEKGKIIKITTSR
jgi:hypothetical protein